MALTFNDSLISRTEALIDERIAHEIDKVAAGQLKGKAYRRACGVIEGLRAAKDMLQQAISDVQKG